MSSDYGKRVVDIPVAREGIPRWEAGQRVLVKCKGTPGPGKSLQREGTVVAARQGGAMVKVDGSGEGFFYHRDIQGMPKRTWKNPKPATHTVVEFTAAPPRITEDPEPSESDPELVGDDDVGAILDRAIERSQAPMAKEIMPNEIPRIGVVQGATEEIEERMPFEEFVEHLCELVIIPADRETRKRWMSLARELHAMTL